MSFCRVSSAFLFLCCFPQSFSFLVRRVVFLAHHRFVLFVYHLRFSSSLRRSFFNFRIVYVCCSVSLSPLFLLFSSSSSSTGSFNRTCRHAMNDVQSVSECIRYIQVYIFNKEHKISSSIIGSRDKQTENTAHRIRKERENGERKNMRLDKDKRRKRKAMSFLVFMFNEIVYEGEKKEEHSMHQCLFQMRKRRQRSRPVR